MAETDRIVVVVGEGRASGSPDCCDVYLAVQGRGPTAAEAIQAMTAAAQAILEAARGAGVANSDLQTTGLAVQEWFRPGSSVSDGYVGHYSLTVSGRSVGEVGETLASLSPAGGDALRINGLALRFSDPEPLQKEARRRAVEDATRTAEDLVAAAGLQLGSVLSMEYLPDPGRHGGVAVARSAGFGPMIPAPIPVEAGSGQVTALVTIRFAVVG